MGQAIAPVGMGILGAGLTVATGGAALPALVPLAMGVAGGAMSAFSGQQQANAYKTQAAEYQQQERMAELQAKSDEANRLDAYTRVIGSNQAFAAAGNISVDSGSMEALQNANRDVLSRSISYTEATKDISVARMEMAAQSDLSAAPWAVIGGIAQGATSIFNAADRYAQVSGGGGGGSAILGPLSNSPTVA
jgi:hypothetical protein